MYLVIKTSEIKKNVEEHLDKFQHLFTPFQLQEQKDSINYDNVVLFFNDLNSQKVMELNSEFENIKQKIVATNSRPLEIMAIKMVLDALFSIMDDIDSETSHLSYDQKIDKLIDLKTSSKISNIDEIISIKLEEELTS